MNSEGVNETMTEWARAKCRSWSLIFVLGFGAFIDDISEVFQMSQDDESEEAGEERLLERVGCTGFRRCASSGQSQHPSVQSDCAVMFSLADVFHQSRGDGFRLPQTGSGGDEFRFFRDCHLFLFESLGVRVWRERDRDSNIVWRHLHLQRFCESPQCELRRGIRRVSEQTCTIQ